MKSVRQALGESLPNPHKEEVNVIHEAMSEHIEEPIEKENHTVQIVKEIVSSTPEKEHWFVKGIRTMLTDSSDDTAISSKRVVAFLAFIFCSVAFFANLFFDYDISPFIYESMIWIVVGGLGFTALEKFAPKSKDD